jgi:hypothetical protein
MRLRIAGVMAGRLIVTAGLAALAQQRDAPVPAVAGAAQIAGRVMSGDASPMPVRRAIVSIAGDTLESPRAAISDDEGRFTFTSLPAGTYSISAKKASYLPAESGASRPGRPGSRIALAAGEKRTVMVTMFRGAAIAGALLNPNGAPVAGISVYALNVRALGQPGPLLQDQAVTDDRGEFRIYGLTPGEYVVTAVPSPGGSGEIGARSAAATNALLAALTQRQNAPAAVGNAPAMAAAPAVGYAPIYFPGTPLLTEAQRIRLAAGDERESLRFEVSRVPVAAIEGTLSGNVPNLTGVQMAILPEGGEVRIVGGPPSMTHVPPNALGEFKYGNLAPGRYQVVARALGGAPEPIPGATGRGRTGGAGSAVVSGTGETLYAEADVEISGSGRQGPEPRTATRRRHPRHDRVRFCRHATAGRSVAHQDRRDARWWRVRVPHAGNQRRQHAERCPASRHLSGWDFSASLVWVRRVTRFRARCRQTSRRPGRCGL